MKGGFEKGWFWLRNAPSTAGNSMTGSESPSPAPLLKKEASPAVPGGERILEMLWRPQMNALNCTVWGILEGNSQRCAPAE